MSSPTFVPRDIAIEPRLFGRTAELDWKSVTDVRILCGPDVAPTDARADAVLRAAQMQNRYSFRVRSRLRTLRYPLKAYAEISGCSYDRTSKVLRGWLLMRLEDVAIADVILGEVSEVAIMAVVRQRNEAVEAERLRLEARAARRLQVEEDRAAADAAREILFTNDSRGGLG